MGQGQRINMMCSSRACSHACLLLSTAHCAIIAWPQSLAKHAVLANHAVLAKHAVHQTPSQRRDSVLLKAMCPCLQRWDAPKQEIENGVYLGHIASISFLGPWALQSVSHSLLSMFSQTLFVLRSSMFNFTQRQWRSKFLSTPRAWHLPWSETPAAC